MTVKPIIICGCSGVGKGTLIKRLMEEYPTKFAFSVSHTTRQPRNGEIDGVHYHYTTKEAMLKDIEQGLFVEYAHVHNNLYGTSFKAVRDVLATQRACILDIDIQGAKQVKASRILDPLVIFIKCPSFEELERRLRARGTESEQSIQIRMETARKEDEIAMKNEDALFDAFVVNDDLETAYAQLKQVINKHIPVLNLQ
jgi:guanylate kinase